jgi:uncharacterized protein DUF1838
MNWNDSREGMRAFMKARASIDGTDTWTWFTGTTHAWFPDGKWVPLFAFEGYNVARAVEVEDGFDLLTREAVFYVSLATREPLEKWSNPFTGAEVEVLHIWNDPVNQQMRLDGPRGPFRAPVTGIGEDLFFNADVFLAYPSPLPRAEYPESSQDDLYKAAELFQFFCKRRDVEDPAVLNAPTQVSWTRLAPWLPWMLMADRPGMLVYHGRGSKLNSFASLPAWIRERVNAEAPHFASAPTEITGPNATSWTTFKRLRG